MHAFPFLASKRFDEVRFEDQLVEQRRFDELLQRLDQQRPEKVCFDPRRSRTTRYRQASARLALLHSSFLVRSQGVDKCTAVVFLCVPIEAGVHLPVEGRKDGVRAYIACVFIFAGRLFEKSKMK